MKIEKHIENLKAIASDMPSDRCSDWIESLMAGINAMEELQAHKEAWKKVEVEIDKRIFEPWENHIRDDYFDGLCTAREIAKNLRPKEGDSNADSN